MIALLVMNIIVQSAMRPNFRAHHSLINIFSTIEVGYYHRHFGTLLSFHVFCLQTVLNPALGKRYLMSNVSNKRSPPWHGNRINPGASCLFPFQIPSFPLQHMLG